MNFGENTAKINMQKNILDYKVPLDYNVMMGYINEFSERYPFMSVSSIGESIMGRSIPIIRLGNGERSVLYVGAHHGMEWMTSVLLLRFINEYCELFKKDSRIYTYTLSYLFSTKSIYIIPMLNPDGVDYQINGVGEDNPLYERLLKMNQNSTDFTHWQANARGVDLNHNYNCGFAEYKQLEAEQGIGEGAPTRFSGNMPESEPEVGALCNFLRFNDDIKAILTLHTQGEEIYYTSGERTAPRSKTIAATLSRMTGYLLGTPEGMAAYGGLTDWYISEFNKPSFTIECGRGENPLPLDDYFKIYTDIREMLFMMPTFI
ncbi:MAG: M14 family metallocarboxypeptidase [Clostridia bacterium]|nr:M14 family metallocarboxypeptidase [Clostridia bacterium]